MIIRQRLDSTPNRHRASTRVVFAALVLEAFAVPGLLAARASTSASVVPRQAELDETAVLRSVRASGLDVSDVPLQLLDSRSFVRVILDPERRLPEPDLAGLYLHRADPKAPIYEIPSEQLAAWEPWIVEVLGGVTVHRFVDGSSPHEDLVAAKRDELPELRVTTGDFRLYTGIINEPVPDLDQFVQSQQVMGSATAPLGALTINLEYRLLINNDPAPGDIRCSDYEIYLSSDTQGGAVPFLLVYDNLGGATDGGFDDDTADDADIYLNYRPTSAFDGEDPNQSWHVIVRDTVAGSTGKVEYVDLRVYWELPDSDLTATEVYFRTAAGGGGTRVDDPVAGQDLFPHLDYAVVGPEITGRIWEIELDGQQLCAFDGSQEPGSWIGSCTEAWTVQPGPHNLAGTVDPLNVVSEPNEGDNQVTKAFTVPEPPDIRLDPTVVTLEREMPTPIYVEIDYMEVSPSHSHKPSQDVIRRVRDAFQHEGYAIHLDLSNSIPHQRAIQVGSILETSPAVVDLMNHYFQHIGDDRYFYSIWGHNFASGQTVYDYSGIADTPGRVHLVTLGSFTDFGTEDNRVGTFIHEFGHNLGQLHGGTNDDHCKPNYISVMNYYYQLDGITAGLVEQDFAPPGFSWPIDFSYSHGLLTSLNESALDETFGLGLGHPIDWNGAGGIQMSTVMFDVQDGLPGNACLSDGSLTTIHDFDNWSSIESHIRNRTHLEARGPAQRCIDYETYRPIERRLAELRSRGLIPSKKRASGRRLPRLETAAEGITVHNDGGEPLEVTALALDTVTDWLDWAPHAPFTVAPGDRVELQLFADLWQAPPGRTLRTLTFTSNDPDEPTADVELRIDGLGTCVLTTIAGTGGSTTGDVEAACGTFVTAKAFPEQGFAFSRWTEGGNPISTEAAYTTMMTGNLTLEAEFEDVSSIFEDGFESGDTNAWSSTQGIQP